MDEIEKAALEAAANAVLAPVTNVVSDAIGVLGGDQLAEYRARKRKAREAQHATVVQEAQKLLRNRGATPDPDTPPEWVEEILVAAQDNSILELRDLYARLVAAAVDPKRRPNYRREFVEITKALEPIDTLVLPILRDNAEMPPNRRAFVASRLGATEDQVALSFGNLLALGLTVEPENYNATRSPFLSPLGRQFLLTVAD